MDVLLGEVLSNSLTVAPVGVDTHLTDDTHPAGADGYAEAGLVVNEAMTMEVEPGGTVESRDSLLVLE